MKEKMMGHQREIIGAVLIFAFVSTFILSNFFVGFVLPIYLAAMIPAFFLALLYPRSGFLAMVSLTFIFERFFTLNPIVLGKLELKLYPLDLIIIAIIFGIIVNLIRGGCRISFKKEDALIILFICLSIVYGVISMFFLHADRSLAFSSAKNYAFYALLYFISYFLFKAKDDFKALAQSAVYAGVLIIGFLIYGIVSGEGLWSQYTPLSTEGIRLLAFTHGFYISMVSIFASAYIFLQKNYDKSVRMFFFLLPLWALGIVGSMMRHLWISLAVSILLIIMVCAKRITENALVLTVKYILLAIFAATTIFYLSSLMPNSKLSSQVENMTGMVGKRFVSISNSSDESIFWRSVAWKEAFEKYYSNPLLGIGFGKKISVEIGSYREFVEIRNIHNSFLVVLVQMGLIGLLLLAFSVYLTARKLFAKIRSQNSLLIERVSVAGILVFHLIAFLFQPYLETNLLGIFFWINLGLARSLGEIKESDQIS